jgi:putative ABC transport system permease protein
MNLKENIREGLSSIRANSLRSVLTASIIAIGITALVGILTAIDSIQTSVNSNLASLGANSFDIKANQGGGRRQRRGVEEKLYPPIEYLQARLFKERYKLGGAVTAVYTTVTGLAELKYRSRKTNPNIQLVGGDENYLPVKSFELEKGRNFSPFELDNAMAVVILGNEVSEKLFEKEDPLGKVLTASGNHFKVIGILKKVGASMGGSGSDRMMLIPLEAARALATNRSLTFDITTAVKGNVELGNAVGEATGLMRSLRKDKLGDPNSFEISQSDSLSASLDSIAGYLRIGGMLVGLVTLIGASIGLMNIMLVSVTERTREIGIRKALGATPSKIRQQFLIEAIVICQLGGIAGVVLGILVGNLAALALQSNSFVIPWAWMMGGLAICVVVGLASGYYPAYKASRLDPIESLRFE